VSHKQTARFTPQNGIEELSLFLAPFRQYTVLKNHEDFLRLHRIYKKSRSQEKREDARRRLIYGNVLLVVSEARRQLGRGLSLLDMMQEGLDGIAQALELFDEGHGCQFSTYAVWWIRSHIRRAIINLNERSIYRIPVNVDAQIGHVSSAIISLQHAGNPWPTVDEVEKKLRASTSKTAQQIPSKRIPELIEVAMRQTLPLDASVKNNGNEGQTAYAEIIADTRVTIERDVEAHLLAERLQRLMRTRLTPRERFVLHHRFGIDGAKEMTLNEIGQELDLTREGIRQIEARAMRKLKAVLDAKIARHWQELAESL